jgi:cell division protein FtsB
MKLALAIFIFIFIVLVFVGWQAFGFWRQEKSLNANLSDVESRLAAAQSDEANLQAETQYLANPANLEKELRAQFNYKKPGETMIIIVPPQSASSTGANP